MNYSGQAKTRILRRTLSAHITQTMESTSSFPVVSLPEDAVPGAKFTGSGVEEHTINDKLKRWLHCRGLKITGKRAELIQRFG